MIFFGQLHWVVGMICNILYIFSTISGYVRGISGNVVFHENYGFCGVTFNPFLANIVHRSFSIVFIVIWNANFQKWCKYSIASMRHMLIFTGHICIILHVYVITISHYTQFKKNSYKYVFWISPNHYFRVYSRIWDP